MSPVIRNIVGQPRTTFKRARIILANLDRATLGDMTARLLGGLLIARSTGQVVITDYGFFSAPVPFAQDRFTIALNFLDEVPAKLKQEVLGIDEKYVFKTNKKDADELSFYVGVMNPSMIMDLSNNAFRVTGSDRIHQTVQSHNLRRLTPLKKRTRACHTVPRLKVEREIRGTLSDGDIDPRILDPRVLTVAALALIGFVWAAYLINYQSAEYIGPIQLDYSQIPPRSGPGGIMQNGSCYFRNNNTLSATAKFYLFLAYLPLALVLFLKVSRSEWCTNWVTDQNRLRAAAHWEAKYQSDSDKRRLDVARLANELAQEWEAAPPLPTPADFLKVVCRDLPPINATLLSQVLAAQKSIFADVRVNRLLMRPADARQLYKRLAKACIDGIRAFSSRLPHQLLTQQTGPTLFSRIINLTDADLEVPLYESSQPFRTEWARELFPLAKMRSTNLLDRVRRQNYEHTPEGDREYKGDVNEYYKQEDAVLKAMPPIDKSLHDSPYYTRASLLYPRPITVPFPLREELRFQGHWIIGTQGSGKTTLLRHMFLSDLEKVAAGRASIVLMDSKEDLFKFAKLKRFAKGGDLYGRLVILSPEKDFPLALNPLDLGASTGHTLDLLEHVFASLRDTKQTALQSTLFRSIFLLLINVPGASLADFRKVLTDGIADYQQHMHKLHP